MSHKSIFGQRVTRLVLAVLGAVLLAVSLILPVSFSDGRYASPDETAVVRVTERLAAFQSPRIAEPLALDYPWLHPRSWVSQGKAVVPVGFLGWPLLLAPFAIIVGSRFLPFVAWLWFVSSLYPFYQLLRSRFSETAALIGMITMAATPMFLLYANRSFFPNAGLLAAGLWSLWAMERAKQKCAYWWLAGLLMGMVMVIRPIELVWIMPWWFWMWRGVDVSPKISIGRILPTFFVIFLGYLALNAFTYGAWWKIGYWIQDNPTLNTKNVLSDSSLSLHAFFPFGIHPRSILWNIRSFTRVFLWPTAAVVLLAFITYLRRLSIPFSLVKQVRSHPFIWLSFWTVFTLLLIYGSGMYRDHIQPGAVTVANSFLRYLLPLAPLTGVAAAYLFEYHVFSRSRSFLALFLTFLWVGFGVYAVGIKDDEGVFTTRREIARYVLIHERANELFPPGSVIVSERSDKIFGPSLRSVSPLPTLEELVRLVKDPSVHQEVALFARPLSQRQRDDWHRLGVEVLDVGAFGREHLFRLIPR